jgi:hypothetical protein
MTKIPPKCPSCSSPLVVTQLGCTHCDTTIVGHYPLSPFLRLSEDSLQFLEAFVRNRGNVKEMERELGQSYWIVRTRLDKIIEEMGFEAPPDEESLSARRKEILEQLHQGEISAEEAAKGLTELGKR